jgi:RHS repeat-associated protein
MQWDKTGNLCFQKDENGYKFFSWTEDNRLQGFYHNRGNIAALYRYDAGGQRDLKLTAKVTDVNVNGHYYRMPIFTDATLYAGNLMTVNRGGYTKHYFAGTERLLSNVAGGGQPNIDPQHESYSMSDENPHNLSDHYTKFVENYFDYYANMTDCERNDIELPADIQNLPYLNKEYDIAMKAGGQDKLYYFNANHLGSGSLITDGSGQTYQILAYAPYGESLVNIRHFPNESYDERHQFTGYEKDEETGLSYAGARYYWDKVSIPISVDPHAERYPWISGYNYGFNNPIKYNDPTGMDGEITGEGTKDNPYVIHAAYYYQNGALSDAEVQGLNDARDAYNNAGTMNVKGVGMVKYNIEVQGVDDPLMERQNNTVVNFEDGKFFGNRVSSVSSKNVKTDDGNNVFGTSNRNEVKFVNDKIQGTIESMTKSEQRKFFKAIMIHEIGHNLGGDHSINNSVMDTRGFENLIFPEIDHTLTPFTREIFQLRDTQREKFSEGRLWTRWR